MPHKDAEVRAAYHRQYKQTNRARINERSRERRAERRRHGRCPLCLTKDAPLVRDHCHKLGHTRGYICNHCNLALGHVKDDPATLVRCIAYLKGSRI